MAAWTSIRINALQHFGLLAPFLLNGTIEKAFHPAGDNMNVKRIEADRLNFWVAKSAGLKLLPQVPEPGANHDPENGFWHPRNFHPASDWSHAGPIVSNEWYVIEDMLLAWFGPQWTQVNAIMCEPLKWFMRAYVASQFGDEVEDACFPGPAQDVKPVDTTVGAALR
jgi:hypothetical protein